MLRGWADVMQAQEGPRWRGPHNIALLVAHSTKIARD
jgi:hypothetical protein